MCKILLLTCIDLPLVTLELSNCHLGDDGGKVIGNFLMNNSAAKLKRLELKGNNLGEIGCQAIGYGLERFKGQLDYIGSELTRNYFI